MVLKVFIDTIMIKTVQNSGDVAQDEEYLNTGHQIKVFQQLLSAGFLLELATISTTALASGKATTQQNTSAIGS